MSNNKKMKFFAPNLVTAAGVVVGLCCWLVLPIAVNATCYPAVPFGCPSDGCKCGTDKMDDVNFADIMEVSYTHCKKKWNGICYKYSSGTTRFNYRSSCQIHDWCYYAVEDHPIHCHRKYETCNKVFKDKMYKMCEDEGRHNCDTNECKDQADNFLFIVEGLVDAYYEMDGCDASNDPTPKAIKNSNWQTYLRARESGEVDQAAANNSYEKWVIQEMDDAIYVDGTNKVALYNHVHSLYLRARSDGTVDAVPWAQDHELWTLLHTQDGKIGHSNLGMENIFVLEGME